MPIVYLIPNVLAADTQQMVILDAVKETIKGLHTFMVEDLKTARRFISSLKLGIVIDELELILVNKESKYDDVMVQMMELHSDIGVISESGCPAVADPGAVVVDIAHQLGWVVNPMVGPNSILLALMGSGLSGQNFAFNGYLPIEEKEKEKKVKSFENIALTQKQTQIFIETPYRNKQVLATLLKVLNPNTRLCIACNLTAGDQYIKTLSVSGWRKLTSFPDIHKKPTIFLFL